MMFFKMAVTGQDLQIFEFRQIGVVLCYPKAGEQVWKKIIQNTNISLHGVPTGFQ